MASHSIYKATDCIYDTKRECEWSQGQVQMFTDDITRRYIMKDMHALRVSRILASVPRLSGTLGMTRVAI